MVTQEYYFSREGAGSREGRADMKVRRRGYRKRYRQVWRGVDIRYSIFMYESIIVELIRLYVNNHSAKLGK